jgi:hypothetical protein
MAPVKRNPAPQREKEPQKKQKRQEAQHDWQRNQAKDETRVQKALVTPKMNFNRIV